MDNRYYHKVIAEMQDLFTEQNFVSFEDGSFRNDKRAVKVEYNDERQSYVLLLAEVSGETVGEYAEAAAWLFDDTQTEKDAESVGIDFCETVRENIGAKVSRSVNSAIELPSVSKGDSYNVTALTKKMLDVYPALKDSYKSHVAHYENFLYLDFYGTYVVPQIKATLLENNKKNVKKLMDVLENAYVQGDKEAVNLMVVTLAAVCTDQKAKANLMEAFGDNKHFASAVENFIPALGKNSKLKKLLLK